MSPNSDTRLFRGTALTLFTQSLLEKGFDLIQIVEISKTIDEVCNHCWDNEAGCRCWDDE